MFEFDSFLRRSGRAARAVKMTSETAVRKSQASRRLAHRPRAIATAARRLDAELFDARRPLPESLAAPQQTYLDGQDDVALLSDLAQRLGDLFHRRRSMFC